jgi:hypothetical protein
MELIFIAFVGTVGLVIAELRDLLRRRPQIASSKPSAAPRLVARTFADVRTSTDEQRYDNAA